MCRAKDGSTRIRRFLPAKHAQRVGAEDLSNVHIAPTASTNDSSGRQADTDGIDVEGFCDLALSLGSVVASTGAVSRRVVTPSRAASPSGLQLRRSSASRIVPRCPHDLLQPPSRFPVSSWAGFVCVHLAFRRLSAVSDCRRIWQAPQPFNRQAPEPAVPATPRFGTRH